MINYYYGIATMIFTKLAFALYFYRFRFPFLNDLRISIYKDFRGLKFFLLNTIDKELIIKLI